MLKLNVGHYMESFGFASCILKVCYQVHTHLALLYFFDELALFFIMKCAYLSLCIH